MTHHSSSSSSSNNHLDHESSSTTASRTNIESEKFILPPISSMDGFFQSRSWPPPATTFQTTTAASNDNMVSPASNSSFMSMQETLLSPPLPRPNKNDNTEPSWSPIPNRSSDSHPHNQPRLDYFTTSSTTSAAAATHIAPSSYYSSSMDRDDVRYQINEQRNHRDHHYRQNSLPQLSTTSFRKNSINSIISSHQQQHQLPPTPTAQQYHQQSVFRYQQSNTSSSTTSTSPSSSSTSNYNHITTSMNNMLSPTSLSSTTTTTPSLRGIENDIDEVIRHCNTLAENMSQRKGSIVENDNYFSNPVLMRPWLDDMIGRANEVLNALLRLRKYQLAAEHAKLHRTSDHQNLSSQRGSEDGVNWDATNTISSSSGVMTLNSVRHKKRGKRSTFQNRCHSCNISETPEWRRGPDGARTLCNACGLHYAKLAKKVKQEGEAKKEMMEDKDDTSMK